MIDNLPQLPREREAFEAEFPPPSGVTWDGYGYGVADSRLNSYRCDRFVGQWSAWKARAAIDADRAARGAVPALTITGHQLREALEFLAPDGTAEQLDEAVCIQHGPARINDAGTTDETTDPAGLYCWLADYPEEGSIYLHEELAASPQPQPVQAQQFNLQRTTISGWGQQPIGMSTGQPSEKATSESQVLTFADVASRVCRAVAELPDRNSPEGWPDAMLVTQSELHGIMMDALDEWIDCIASMQAQKEES